MHKFKKIIFVMLLATAPYIIAYDKDQKINCDAIPELIAVDFDVIPKEQIVIEIPSYSDTDSSYHIGVNIEILPAIQKVRNIIEDISDVATTYSGTTTKAELITCTYYKKTKKYLCRYLEHGKELFRSKNRKNFDALKNLYEKLKNQANEID